MKYTYLIFILVLFQGCVFTTSTVNKSSQGIVGVRKAKKLRSIKKDNSSMYEIQIEEVKKANQINFQRHSYSGSIKGVVKNLSYDKNKKLWFYEIHGIDTSNSKLPYAEFYNPKKLAKVGDFVYAILNNSNLKELFFIKKANKIVKRSTKAKKLYKSHRRDKSRKSPGIAVPTVENVTF